MSQADRRARKVVATASGKRTLRQLDRRVRAAEDALLGILDDTDREVLRGLLRKVACDLRDIESDDDPCTVLEHALAETS